MAIKKIYTAVGKAEGGRGGGTAKTDDGMLDLILAHPVKMGGDGKGTNPEQLFAVGYASCFLGAMKFANGKDKKPLELSKDSSVTAHVSFGPRADFAAHASKPVKNGHLSMRVSSKTQRRASGHMGDALANGPDNIGAIAITRQCHDQRQGGTA